MALLAALVAIALVVALVVTRGGSDDDASPPPEDPPSPTPLIALDTPLDVPLETSLGNPLADYDTTTLTVQRAGFCDLIPAAEVEAVLGGSPRDTRTYDNGQSTVLTAEVTDIAAEHGCRWKRGPAVARAWVFAPPVSPENAARLVSTARRTTGCSVRRGAPEYGSPTLARTCPVAEGYEVSYRGLFGDAWLVCSLARPGARAATLLTAGEWCVAVAEAAAQPPA